MADFNKLFKVHIDLDHNQLLNAVLEKQPTTPPVAPVEGQMYWSVSASTAYVYDGATWLDMTNMVTSLSGLSDTTIASVAAGEIIKWDGAAWINNTLAEAGISSTAHNHTLDSLSAVTITANSAGELLMWDGSAWINATLAEGGIAPTVHYHALSGLTDITITSVTTGETLIWDGSDWINQTLAEAGISSTSHNHTVDSLSNVTITANSNGELLMWNGSAWINRTLAELGMTTGDISLSGLTDVTVTTVAAGEIIKWNGSDWVNQTLVEANIAPLDAFGSHTGNTSIHFVINDAGTSLTEVWSASKISSEISAINDVITGALVYKGGYNASTNSPLLDSTPITGITVGWTYTVTAAGTFFTEPVQIGDMIIAEVNSPTVLADWTIVNKNIPDIVSATESAEGIIEIATSGETATGTDDTRAVTPLKLEQKVASYRYSANIGNGALTSISVSHGLNSLDVINKVVRVSDGKVIICDDVITSSAVVTFNFNVAPTSSEYRVTIQK